VSPVLALVLESWGVGLRYEHRTPQENADALLDLIDKAKRMDEPMPLPKLGLKPGYTSWRSGKGHQSIVDLFRDLHLGVLELGVGKCLVLAHDHVQREPHAFGFDLRSEKDPEVNDWWEFFISIDQYRWTAEKLPPLTREVVTTTQGRARLARLFEMGLSPENIEARLGDPAVRFLEARIKKLQARVDEAQKEAQKFKDPDEEKTWMDKQRVGMLLRPNPATTHFFLQHELAALSSLLHDLEVGKHLE
jgi:hypothetical protein